MSMNASQDFRNRVPQYLMMSGVILLTVLATLKLQYWQGGAFLVGILVIGSYLVWLLSESSVSASESSKGQTSKDKGTCELYAFGRLLTVLVAMAMPTIWQGGWATALGVALFVFGVLFRLNAIQVLGQFYSHRVRLIGEHQVVDTGPYRIVRHPAYTGMLCAHLGFVLVFFNYWALAACLLVLFPAVVMRIRIEEEALMTLPGYPAYAQAHKRLIPWIW